MMSFFKKVLPPFRRAGQETAAPTTPSVASRIAAASAIVLFSLPASGFAGDSVEYRVEAKRFGEVETSYRDPYGNRFGTTKRGVQGGTVETQWFEGKVYVPPRHDRGDYRNYNRRGYREEGRTRSGCGYGQSEVWVQDRDGNMHPMCQKRVYREGPSRFVLEN